MPHALDGKTVRLRDDVDSYWLAGREFRIEGLWINVGGRSWMTYHGNFACLDYASRVRSSEGRLPIGDDGRVFYGKIDNSGYLIHESEIDPSSIPGAY